MRLVMIIKFLPLILLPLLSCDKNTALFPLQCDCTIETTKLTHSSTVTYHVFTNDDATVSAVTYQTSKGLATVQRPSMPFRTTTKMKAGETVSLTAVGHPGKGNIVLTYEIENSDDKQGMLSTSMSKVWVMKDGKCQ